MVIKRKPDVLGGEPYIKGSRVGVITVYYEVYKGETSVDEFVEEYSEVSEADVFDALAYICRNKEYVKKLCREHEESFEEERKRVREELCDEDD